MAEYKKDITVSVIRPTKPLVSSDFTKVLYITNDIDVPITRYSTLEGVTADFPKTSDFYKGLEVAMSQSDFDGNKISTNYFFCGGYVPTAGSTTELEKLLDETTETGFYGIVIPFYEQATLEWLNLWLTRNSKFALCIAEKPEDVTNQLKASDRIIFYYKETGEYPVDVFGQTGQTLFRGADARWKDRRINGADSSVPNDIALESKLLEANINATVDKYGYFCVTNNCICADGTTFADQRIKLDSIIHDVELNLGRLLVQSKNLPFDYEGLQTIESLLDRVLILKGQDGIIAKDQNNNYLYKITMPSLEDTNAETGITVDDFINRTLRNVKIDFTMSSEIHSINVTLVWYDEPITRVGGAE